MDDDIDKQTKMVKAREDLVGKVLKELGSLPRLNNNKHQITEMLGVKVKRQTNLSQPPVGIIDEWTLIYEEFLCVSLYMENQTDLHGVIKCSFIRDDGSTSQVETRFAPYRTAETYSWIRPYSSKRFLACTNKEILQHKAKTCTLFVDWIFTASGQLESTLDPQFLSLFPPSETIQYSPINFTFQVKFPEREKIFTQNKLYNELNFPKNGNQIVTETDIENILQCLYLCREYIHFDHSNVELQLALECFKDDFEISDYGDWQLVLSNETSVWNGCIIYLISQSNKKMPNKCVAFSKNRNELINLEKVISNAIKEGYLIDDSD
uniref:Uncharacterized protein n=1 Tax=Acrobeloides nanus TaxID=290746 RepID=A0A914BZM4_9BILA